MCDHDGLDWEDMGLAGALAEQIAEEENERATNQEGNGGGAGKG